MAAEGDKPHAATAKRREDARKEGRFARARDTTTIAVLGAVLAATLAYSDRQAQVIHEFFQRCHGDLSAVQRGDGDVIAAAIPGALYTLAVPPAIAAAVAGGLAGAWQAGFRFYPEMLSLKFEKLNPLPKLKELVNFKHAIGELIISMMRVCIVAWVCYRELLRDVPPLLGMTGAPVAPSVTLIAQILTRLALKSLAVLVVLGVLDYAYNRYQLEKSMRMSDQELRDEMRQYDQNPKIKAKIREKMQQASRKRVLAAVASADAIVTNPTHIAVALRYSDKDFAPVVVAKGHDEFALKIRAEARKHGIPILENRRLARALDAEVEIGRSIPGQHYVAVAKVLAFVYSLRGAKKRRTPRKSAKTASRSAQVARTA